MLSLGTYGGPGAVSTSWTPCRQSSWAPGSAEAIRSVRAAAQKLARCAASEPVLTRLAGRVITPPSIRPPERRNPFLPFEPEPRASMILAASALPPGCAIRTTPAAPDDSFVALDAVAQAQLVARGDVTPHELALAAIALPSALALECDEAMTGFHDNDIKSQAWQDIAHANVQAVRDAVADDPCYAMMRAGDGRGPLFWAHEFYNQEIIDVLVHHGADRAARDRGGKRPDQMIRAPPMTFEAPPADDEEEYEYGADDDDDDVYVTKSSPHDEM